ncbi:MAG: hypothetical protein O2820_11765 [Planctomycetota bacterium]|nr:hypothetical protein [Planctomycetota bacterium]MDA1249887.1 hypothetical protein [Planctomycetota bacterium]
MRTTSLQTAVAPPSFDVPSEGFRREAAPAPSASWHRSGSLVHCRRVHRIPFSGRLRLRGLNENHEPVDVELVATGRDISGDGISFRHDNPLPYRFVEVTYNAALGTVTRRAKLTWCRYAVDGFYVSGGRFLRQP